MIKRWYYSASHWRLGDVMMANITFLSFLLFSTCHSIHAIHVAVNTWLNCSFFTLIVLCLWYCNCISCRIRGEWQSALKQFWPFLVAITWNFEVKFTHLQGVSEKMHKLYALHFCSRTSQNHAVSAKCPERSCFHYKGQCLNTAIKYSLVCNWQVNY